MKKEEFKSLLKMKCKNAVFKYLSLKKETKSKLDTNKYNKLELQTYLSSGDINLRRKQMLFKLRTRMMPTSENFGLDRNCKICTIELDTTDHVFSCFFLKFETPEILGQNIEYTRCSQPRPAKKDILLNYV